MISQALKILGIAILGVALWKLFGGSPEAVVTGIWNWVTGIIDGISDWINEQGLLNWLK